MAEEVVEDVVEETVETPEWVSSIEDADLKSALSKFESQDKLLETIGYKAPEFDWKEAITDEDGKAFAKSSTDLNHFVRRALDMRKRESLVRVPGKDATDEEKATYYKAIGVPEDIKGYEFPAIPEEQMTPEIQASRNQWAERFHSLNIPKEAATALIQAVAEDSAAAQAAQAKADEDYVKAQEETLKSEWKGDDYDKNIEVAKRAFQNIAERAGLNVNDVLNIEGKDGRSLLGRAEVVKMFATLAKEMGESTFGPMLSESEMETLDDQISELRDKQATAQAKGDSNLANKLYQQEQTLLEKKDNSPIVGSRGRAA